MDSNVSDFQSCSAASLRQALLWNVDLRIVTRAQAGGRAGPWMCLTVDQMRQVYQYRRNHMSGFHRTCSWAATLPKSDVSLGTRAYAFWHNLDPCRANLPDICVAGLISATQWCIPGGVKLLCYDKLCVPDKVEIVSAEAFLPRSRMQSLLDQGVHIALIADLVRLMALQEGGVGGWLIDADTLWLRAPEMEKFPWNAPAWGHVFASMQAHPGRRSALQNFQFWTVEFLKEPMDMLYLATPFYFPAKSILLQEIVHELQVAMQHQHIDSWTENAAAGSSIGDMTYGRIMDTVRGLIRKHGLEGAIQSPKIFSPLGYGTWKRDKLVDSPPSEVLTRMMQEITASSTAVNMFWSSSKDGCAHERGSLAKMDPNSVLASLLGANTDELVSHCRRKRKTGKLPWPDAKPMTTFLQPGLSGLPDFSAFTSQYMLRKFLNKGSYGMVYVAEDRSNQQKRAVKIMRDLHGAISTKEVYIHRSCMQHDNVVDLFDAFVSPFYTIMVMPLARQTLYTFVRNNAKSLTSDITKVITAQIAAGLAHIHSKGIIHRDIHSGNVLLFHTVTDCSSLQSGSHCEDGVSSSAQELPNSGVRLADFGLSCPGVSEGNDMANKFSVTVVGGYNAAPEVLFVSSNTKRVHYTSALDVWALACLAAEIGRRGRPLFFTPKGRDGIRGAIIEKLGSPPVEISDKYRWPVTKVSFPAKEIHWGLWEGDDAKMLFQQALRYDMYMRPTMESIVQAFKSY